MIADTGFDRKSTAEDVTAGLDLSGQTILITGVGSGLGQEAMRVLALRGAHIVGLDRRMKDALAACQNIAGSATPYECDLSDPDSITACAAAIKKDVKTLDVVLTNAGVMAPPHTVVHKYSEPLELQFAVNFLGHFVLINHLMPLVAAAPAGRFAIVASEGYVSAPKKTGIKFDDLDSSEKYSALEDYGQSKLAVMLFSKELARRLDGGSMIANSIHPGVIRTNLAADTQSFLVKMISAFAGPWTRTIAQGAATHCFVAAHPSLAGLNGLHFADSQLRPTRDKDHPRVNDTVLAEQLWAKAQDLAAEYLAPEPITN